MSIKNLSLAVICANKTKKHLLLFTLFAVGIACGYGFFIADLRGQLSTLKSKAHNQQRLLHKMEQGVSYAKRKAAMKYKTSQGLNGASELLLAKRELSHSIKQNAIETYLLNLLQLHRLRLASLYINSGKLNRGFKKIEIKLKFKGSFEHIVNFFDSLKRGGYFIVVRAVKFEADHGGRVLLCYCRLVVIRMEDAICSNV